MSLHALVELLILQKSTNFEDFYLLYLRGYAHLKKTVKVAATQELCHKTNHCSVHLYQNKGNVFVLE